MTLQRRTVLTKKTLDVDRFEGNFEIVLYEDKESGYSDVLTYGRFEKDVDV